MKPSDAEQDLPAGVAQWTEWLRALTGSRGLCNFPFSSSQFESVGGSNLGNSHRRRRTFTHILGAMGTVNELCVTSFQTFVCPAVKGVQQSPGKVRILG